MSRSAKKYEKKIFCKGFSKMSFKNYSDNISSTLNLKISSLVFYVFHPKIRLILSLKISWLYHLGRPCTNSALLLPCPTKASNGRRGRVLTTEFRVAQSFSGIRRGDVHLIRKFPQRFSSIANEPHFWGSHTFPLRDSREFPFEFFVGMRSRRGVKFESSFGHLLATRICLWWRLSASRPLVLELATVKIRFTRRDVGREFRKLWGTRWTYLDD